VTSSSGSLFVPRNFTPVSAYAGDIVLLCHHSNVCPRPCSYSFSSQERFDSLSSFYCRGARAAIICYDLTDRASFESLQGKWVKKVMEEAELGCHICIVGTKLDLIQAQMATRAVPKEEVEALSAKHNACVFETSAKVGTEKKAHLDRRMWWCFQVSSEGGQGCRGFFMFVM